jgi:hypothetical protein
MAALAQALVYVLPSDSLSPPIAVHFSNPVIVIMSHSVATFSPFESASRIGKNRNSTSEPPFFSFGDFKILKNFTYLEDPERDKLFCHANVFWANKLPVPVP